MREEAKIILLHLEKAAAVACSLSVAMLSSISSSNQEEKRDISEDFTNERKIAGYRLPLDEQNHEKCMAGPAKKYVPMLKRTNAKKKNVIIERCVGFIGRMRAFG